MAGPGSAGRCCSRRFSCSGMRDRLRPGIHRSATLFSDCCSYRLGPCQSRTSKEGTMKRLVHAVLGTVLALAASAAWGTYHFFAIEEIFSNADGTIQYVVLRECCGMNGENMLGGHTFTAVQGTTTNTYVFTNDLPGGECDYYGCMPAITAHKHVLIATKGFAAVNLV